MSILKQSVLKEILKAFGVVILVALIGTCLASCSKAENYPQEVEFLASVDGWDEAKDMPLIAHIKAKAEDGSEVDFYTSVVANKNMTYRFSKKINSSSLSVEWLSALCNDGGLWSTNDKNVKATFFKKDAKDVTEEEVEQALSAISNAIKKGDSTLSGDKSLAIIEKAKEAANNNPHTDKETIEEKVKEAEKIAEDYATNENAQTGSMISSQLVSCDGEASESGSSSKVSSGGSSGQSLTPAHSHSWTPVYTQVYVVDQTAWNEQVCVGEKLVCTCGAVFDTVNDWDNHMMSLGRVDSRGHSYSSQFIYETINHPEEGHYEQVIDHYECSCGAAS